MKRSHALAIAKTPHIQVYESLTELLRLVARMGYKLQIICPERIYEDAPLWKVEGVEYYFVKPKKTKLQMPTTLRLLVRAIIESFKNHPKILIGCDGFGNIIAAFLHRLLKIHYIYYG